MLGSTTEAMSHSPSNSRQNCVDMKNTTKSTWKQVASSPFTNRLLLLVPFVGKFMQINAFHHRHQRKFLSAVLWQAAFWVGNRPQDFFSFHSRVETKFLPLSTQVLNEKLRDCIFFFMFSYVLLFITSKGSSNNNISFRTISRPYYCGPCWMARCNYWIAIRNLSIASWIF